MIEPRTRSPEEWESEIERTRADMDRTLAALSHRLSRDALMERTIQYLRGRGGEWAAGVGRVVRDNPVPALVLGTGLAWLIMESRRPARAPRSSDPSSARRADPHRPPATSRATVRTPPPAPRFTAADVAHGAEPAAGAARAHGNA